MKKPSNIKRYQRADDEAWSYNAKRFNNWVCKFHKHLHKKEIRIFSLENVHRGSADKRPHNHSHYIIKNKNPDWHNFRKFFLESSRGE